MTDVRGMTIEHVEAALRAELRRQANENPFPDDVYIYNEGDGYLSVDGCVNTRALAVAMLKSLVEEGGHFSVPVELIMLGGNEPCSVQRMFDATIGAALHYEAQQANTPLPPRMKSR